MMIGEVSTLPADDQALLAIVPHHMDNLTSRTTAACWHTPLSVEDAISGLMPADIQARIGRRIAEDWKLHEDALVAAWKPIAARLTREFIATIAPQVERALKAREEELLAVGADAMNEIAREWPVIQERLNPILQQHLTPVLSELLDDALDQAPKAKLAWYISINRNDRAFKLILDWLSNYLAKVSEADKEQLAVALRRTWDAAGRDAMLVGRVRTLMQRIREDPRLGDLISGIYQDAIGQNPLTSEFMRERILQSNEIQQELYRFIEVFAPTARHIARTILFSSHDGQARPEVVYLLRSVALDREVGWVTLRSTAADPAPLLEDTVLQAAVHGGTR
jgi:hypothetical protein